MCKAWQVFEGGSEGDDDEAQLEAVLDPSKVSAIYTISINVCICNSNWDFGSYSKTFIVLQLEVWTAVEAAVGIY